MLVFQKRLILILSYLAEKLLPKHTPGTKHYSQYLTERVNQNFVFESADPLEVMNIIDSLDPGKGSGPYSIPNNVLKTLKFNLCHPLKTIINMSFVTGVYPDQLKIAKVIPTFKKGDKLLVSKLQAYLTTFKYQ